MKKIIIILLSILLSNCGYTPLYKENINQNINIKIVSFNGDQFLNKKLNDELNKYYKNNSNDIFKIKIITSLDKKILSKDSKGNTTNIELNANVIFTIVGEVNEESFSFNENLKIKNRNDSFEQKEYENIIIQNFAKSIKQKLILKLDRIRKNND